ncbi:hypothetical protein ACOSQ2_001483 [Xanthoceras sorbifolium]
MFIRSQITKKENSGRSNIRKGELTKEEKKQQYYTHCNMNGHLKESCFKLVGYPNWFKQLKDQKKKESRGRGETTGRFAANLTNTSLAIDEGQNAELVNMIQQELLKMMKGKSPVAKMVNFAHLDEYAGPAE